LSIEGDLTAGVSEAYLATGGAKFRYGDEGCSCKAWDDVGRAGLWWELYEIELADVCRLYNFPIG